MISDTGGPARAAVGPSVAALAPLQIGPFENEQTLVFGVIALVVVLVGLAMVYSAAKNLVRAYRIWSNDPVDAGSAHLEEGVVEVQGSAEPLDGTLTGKYSGEPCLGYSWKKKRKKRTHDSDGGTETEWQTVASGESAVPFLVSDETGEVAVDPEEASLSFDTSRESSGARTRKYEGRLEPGETVHVYGQKRTAATADETLDGEDVYIGAGDGDATFTVSDTTEGRTVLRYAGKGVMLLVFAAVWLGIFGVAATSSGALPVPT